MVKRRAVFLDRDGVLVRSVTSEGRHRAARSQAEFAIFDDAATATAALHRAGFLLVLATNQPDVGNGIVSRDTVQRLNAIVQNELGLDSVKVCFHSQRDGCACRKPQPGMLLEAAREFDLDLSRSYMVGDRPSDVACGVAAGCYTIFVDRRQGEPLIDPPDAIVGSMADAAAHILRRHKLAS